MHVDHRERTRAAAERAADGDADAARADVETEHGAVEFHQACPLWSAICVMSTPMLPAAACQRASSGVANNRPGIHRHGQPAVLDEFLFELPRAPAGAAERDDRVRRTFAAGHRFEDVARGGDVERRRRSASSNPNHRPPSCSTKPRSGWTGPPASTICAEQRVVLAVDAHLLEDFAQRVLGRAIDDHAHRAFVVVLAHQRHAAREMRVGQRRQRDQQLVGEGGAECLHGPF